MAIWCWTGLRLGYEPTKSAPLFVRVISPWNGDVLNRALESGVLLLVDGDLTANNVIKAGATIIVLGSVRASGLVIGQYNDGVLRVGGDLDASAFLLFDHDGFVRGETRARRFTDDDGAWHDVLVPALFEDEEEFHPDVSRIWAYQHAGKEIFLPA